LGSANSQIRLAWLYIKGFGVLPDEKQAYAWLTVAIASGLDSPSEVAKANALKTALIHDLSVRDNAGTELKDAQNLAEQYYKKYVLQEKPVSQNPSTT
jgi:TPR repeat protein